MHPWIRSVLAAVALSVTVPALAATCNDPGGFEKWLDDIRREAAAQGVSQSVIDAGLSDITYDPAVIRRDRGQGFFQQSFEQFSAKMVPAYRIEKGTALLKRHAGLLAQIERQYGVPGEIVVAIWGLEGDFGAASTGKFPVIQSLASLAYDCRRSALFTQHLFDALRIVQRGDLSPSEMRGAWAGELGQTQFMASNYYRFAVDFDGDGRRDLFRSTPDVLASTANYLRAHGWQRGGSWEPGTANYQALKGWNKSDVYARTIGYFAGRIGGGGQNQ
jgi:lytic murein transglycosylase